MCRTRIISGSVGADHILSILSNRHVYDRVQLRQAYTLSGRVVVLPLGASFTGVGSSPWWEELPEGGYRAPCVQ